jgi:hypothetical protein
MRDLTGPSIAAGLLDPEHLLYALHPERARTDRGARRAYEAIGRALRYLAVLRSHPDYAPPESVRARIRKALADA